jgi:uncharacterized delta-60 repeat protein
VIVARFFLPFALVAAVAFDAAATCPGTLDTGFGDDGLAIVAETSLPATLHVEAAPDGSITTLALGSQGSAIFRHDPDGQRDLSFGQNGFAARDLPAPVVRLEKAPDGSIVVAGEIEISDPENEGETIDAMMLARLEADGSRRSGFGEDGVSVLESHPYAFPNDLLVRSDGTIVAFGNVTLGSDDSEPAAYFFTEDGELASTPAENPARLAPSTEAIATAAAQAPDGSLIVASLTPYVWDMVLSKLTGGGVLDASFARGGWRHFRTPFYDELPGAVATDALGRIYVAGMRSEIGVFGRGRLFLRRFLRDGRPDRSYGRRGRAATAKYRRIGFTSLVVNDDGYAVIAGKWRDGPPTLMRITPDGSRDSTFGVEGLYRLRLAEGSVVSALALQDDGRIVVAGSSNGMPVLLRMEGGVQGPLDDCVADCGNAEVSPLEQCDDGNTATGDGCNAICQHE